MKKINPYLLLAVMFVSGNGYALSPAAEQGKALYPACHVCHNPSQDPPLGPPMWGVKRRYQRALMNEEEFVQRMMSFVKAPSEEKAIHDEALKQLGLMPAMPFDDETLHKIVSYILEEQFAPPCDHWQIAIKRAEAKGDMDHASKDMRQYERFCQPR